VVPERAVFRPKELKGVAANTVAEAFAFPWIVQLFDVDKSTKLPPKTELREVVAGASQAPRKTGDELEAALQLLGVRRTDSLAQIKIAYRRQLSIYHPDKLIGAGAKPAQVQAATEKTRALHNAYALVRKHL